MSIAPSELRAAVRLLRGAGKVVALTGAGMSAESGIPTFRDARSGYWSRFDPEDLATEAAYRRHPDVVFGWYLGRLRQVREAVPHAGYRALVALEQYYGGLPVVTQNVDGLHARAGSSDVIELHGSLQSFRCLDRGHPFPVGTVLSVSSPEDGGSIDPPVCVECGSLVRPGVVWFGEILPGAAVARAWQLAEEADVVLVVGTSAAVYPAAELPVRARATGAKVIEVNPRPTPFTEYADALIRAPAGEALPRLTATLAG